VLIAKALLLGVVPRDVEIEYLDLLTGRSQIAPFPLDDPNEFVFLGNTLAVGVGVSKRSDSESVRLLLYRVLAGTESFIIKVLVHDVFRIGLASVGLRASPGDGVPFTWNVRPADVELDGGGLEGARHDRRNLECLPVRTDFILFAWDDLFPGGLLFAKSKSDLSGGVGAHSKS
jgi:hypothetical protein